MDGRKSLFESKVRDFLIWKSIISVSVCLRNHWHKRTITPASHSSTNK